MRYYELMIVVSPQVDDEGLSATLDRMNGYVTQRGGSVVRQERWGQLRRLAYPIRNYNEGNYVLTHLEMDPQDTKALEASLMLSEDVLRHLLVKIEAIPPRESGSGRAQAPSHRGRIHGRTHRGWRGGLPGGSRCRCGRGTSAHSRSPGRRCGRGASAHSRSPGRRCGRGASGRSPGVFGRRDGRGRAVTP